MVLLATNFHRMSFPNCVCTLREHQFLCPREPSSTQVRSSGSQLLLLKFSTLYQLFCSYFLKFLISMRASHCCWRSANQSCLRGDFQRQKCWARFSVQSWIRARSRWRHRWGPDRAQCSWIRYSSTGGFSWRWCNEGMNSWSTSWLCYRRLVRR